MRVKSARFPISIIYPESVIPISFFSCILAICESKFVPKKNCPEQTTLCISFPLLLKEFLCHANCTKKLFKMAS